MRDTFGPCSECGGGSFVLSKINFTSTNFLTQDNYCSKCGDSLVSTCISCNGTGNKITLFLNRDKYCSKCGREIEPPDSTCSACNGKGEIYSKHHFCRSSY